MFTERLKNLRKEAGLTQQQIADYFNTSPQSYAQWEKGLRNPSKDSLEKLANYFNVSTDYLLGNTNEKNSNELDIEKVKESLRKSLGFDGSSDIPEEEIESMAQAFVKHFKNQ